MEDAMSDKTSTAPDRADRITILMILAVGVFAGAFIAGTGLIQAVFRLVAPERYPVHLFADIPLETGAGVVSAHGDSLVAQADGLGSGAVWLLAAGDAFAALTVGVVTASFGYVLWRVAQRRPFHRSMQAAILVTGCAVAFGSLLSQGFGGLGQLMAATDLENALNGVALVQFEFAPLPIVVGFGIMALAFVFRAGTRLQRDTEGLV
jgi:hypothetical protein